MDSTIRFYIVISFIGLFLFSACDEKENKNKALTIEWNSEIDSLLNDTIPINLVADSIKREVINAQNDT